MLRRQGAAGRGPVSRLFGRAKADQTPAAELEAAQARVALLRSKLRAARLDNKDLRGELRRTRQVLNNTRSSVRDPHPRVPLSDTVSEVIRQVQAEKLSYLKRANLQMLAKLAVTLETDQIPGLVIEAGTARGGSAIVLAAAKDPSRPMKVYDVFGMIPPPGEHDGEDVHARYAKIVSGKSAGIEGDTYYGYRDNLFDEVTESFARLGVPVAENRVELIQGLFADTIDLDEPVALAHLDGDWYESTMTCLERIAPLLVPGGRIVLDDYYAWSGCHIAVDEYFAGRPEFLVEHRARVHVLRL
jgi:asparagine synthase (glutamine-hydrolysing)